MSFPVSEVAIEAAAVRLLELATVGAPPGEIGGALVPLLPTVDRIVEQRYRGRGAKVDSTLEDLRQDVRMKILVSPPSESGGGGEPLVRFKAWVRRVTSNLLIDRHRRWKRRGCADVVSTEVSGDNSGAARERSEPTGVHQMQLSKATSYGRSPEMVVAAEDEKNKLLDHLKGKAPAVYKLLELIFQMPDASDLELAEALGVSLNVIHKNRQRLREHLVRFREAGALAE